jgi:hypothetical protein
LREKTRTAIQSEVCGAFVALNHNDISEAQAALFRILDLLDKPETLEYAVARFDHGQFQLLMQVG